MKISLFILSGFISSLLSAQQYKVSISEKMSFPGIAWKYNDDYFYKTSGSNNKFVTLPIKVGDFYYCLETETKLQFGMGFKLSKSKYSLKLLKYNSNLEKIKDLEVANGDKVYGPFPPLLKKIHSKPYLLYYDYDDSEEKIKLYATEFDSVSTTQTKGYELLSINQKNLGPGTDLMTMIYNQELKIAFSPDSSKMVLFWYSHVDNNAFFSVTDRNFKIIKSGSAQLNKAEKTILNSTSVDNSGNIFISYTLDSYSPNFIPVDHIYVNTNNGKNDNIKIGLPVGTASKTVVVVPATDNNIKIAGFYSQNSNNLTGVFSQMLNTTDLKLSDPIQIPFPSVVIEQFEKDKLASTSTKKYGLYPITQLDIIPLKDGSFNLTGELDNFTSSKTYFNATGSSYPQYFNSGKDICGSLLNINFSMDNKTTFTRIPKLSESGLKGYYYKVFGVNDQALIFYSDHFDNLSLDITKPPSKVDDYKNSVLIAALISSNGNVQRRIIIDRDKDYRVIPWGIQRLSSSQFIVPLIRFKLFDKSSDEIKWATVSIQ